MAIYIYIWVFHSMVVPPRHPKMIIFSRKTHGCWVPPFKEPPTNIHAARSGGHGEILSQTVVRELFWQISQNIHHTL